MKVDPSDTNQEEEQTVPSEKTAATDENQRESVPSESGNDTQTAPATVAQPPEEAVPEHVQDPSEEPAPQVQFPSPSALAKMKKQELIDFAATLGMELTLKQKKAALLAAIESKR